MNYTKSSPQRLDRSFISLDWFMISIFRHAKLWITVFAFFRIKTTLWNRETNYFTCPFYDNQFEKLCRYWKSLSISMDLPLCLFNESKNCWSVSYKALSKAFSWREVNCFAFGAQWFNREKLSPRLSIYLYKVFPGYTIDGLWSRQVFK